MRRWAMVVVALVATAGSASPAHAKSRGTMVVLGDSISDQAFYAAKGGDPKTIWWAMIAGSSRLRPYVFAERGSGYGVAGKCVGTTIGERIARPEVARRLGEASVVIVAAGVNDVHECYLRDDGTTGYRPTPDDVLDRAVAAAMDSLAASVRDGARVYVTVPIGPREDRQALRPRITSLVSACAAEHGFTYVRSDGGVLAGRRTRDGVHPNGAGQLALYRQLYVRTDLASRYPSRFS